MRCVASVSRAGKSSNILSEEKRKVAWPLDRRWHTRQLGTSLSCMGSKCWSSALHMQGESLTIRQTKGVSLVITKVDLITMIVYCLSGYITNTNGHDRPMVSRNIQPFPAVRKTNVNLSPNNRTNSNASQWSIQYHHSSHSLHTPPHYQIAKESALG